MSDTETRLRKAVEVAESLLSLRATQLCLHQNGNRKARQWSEAAAEQWSEAAAELREALEAHTTGSAE